MALVDKRHASSLLHTVRTVAPASQVDIARHLGGSLSVCYLYEAYEDAENVDLVMELCTGREQHPLFQCFCPVYVREWLADLVDRQGVEGLTATAPMLPALVIP